MARPLSEMMEQARLERQLRTQPKQQTPKHRPSTPWPVHVNVFPKEPITNLDTIYAVIPAWGDWYIGIALRFTIPAFLMSVRACKEWKNVTLRIVTDRPLRFAKLLTEDGINLEFYSPKLGTIELSAENVKKEAATAVHNASWRVFRKAHTEAISNTPKGAVCALLNSDTVISIETMSVIHREFSSGKKVAATTGVRTKIDQSEPVVSTDGLSSVSLAKWMVGNLHQISQDVIFGQGNSGHPTILLFGNNDSNVAMRCFHLCPMFLISDGRTINFKGNSIDDDLLANYRDDEIYYPHNGEFVVAEISPVGRRHTYLPYPMTVKTISDFWRKHYLWPCHFRNFNQRLTLTGNGGVVSETEKQLVSEIERINATTPRF